MQSLTRASTGLSGVGLRRPVVVRSSTSEGIHLWYPLAEAAGTFEIASAIHSLLEAEGFVVANDVLELRPNRKTYDADYGLIRLPLSGEGNEVWVDGFGYCDALSGFHQVWKAAEAKNLFVLPEALKHRIHEHQDGQRKARSRSGRAGAG